MMTFFYTVKIEKEPKSKKMADLHKIFLDLLNEIILYQYLVENIYKRSSPTMEILTTLSCLTNAEKALIVRAQLFA